MIKSKNKIKNENIGNEIVVSKMQREILYANGCTRYDISNYRNGKIHYIKKTKINLMNLILQNEIVDAREFTPLKKCASEQAKYWIIFRGLK